MRRMVFLVAILCAVGGTHAAPTTAAPAEGHTKHAAPAGALPPKAAVDPNMPVVKPTIPAAGGSVIKPQAETTTGTIVVPK